MHDRSCCESPVVSGGTFIRGYDADMGFSYMWPATVSSFRLDTYEVTVGRFRQFVAAGQGTQAKPPAPVSGARVLNGEASQGGWDPAWMANLAANEMSLAAALKCGANNYYTWTDAAAGNENRPIVCITWYEAMAFCAWDGGFLPTEAESMYAASGGGLQRVYPWSSPPNFTTIDCNLANYGGTAWPSTACVVAGADNVGSVSPQGDGVWGQADLGGNVWEWALDLFAFPPPMPCNDCANLESPPFRVLRGGGFRTVAAELRAASRTNSGPTGRNRDVGVRCARSP